MRVDPALAMDSAVEAETLTRAEASAQRWLRRRQLALRILSVVLLVALWETVSKVVPFKAIVSPGETMATIWRELASGELVTQLGFTMRRVAISFGLAMLIGTLLGVGIGAYRAFDSLFSIWVTVFITVPGLIWLVVGYVAFGIRGDGGAIFGVVTMVTPTVLVTIVQGTKALDRHLAEMARLYGHGTRSMLTKVVFPQLLPYEFAAARYGLALTWHMVLFAEIIGRPNGFGFKIFFNYQISFVPGIWAYGIAFVIIALFLEYGVLATLQRRLFRWRQEAAL
jgi:NitT/TauT family transport system permease protein